MEDGGVQSAVALKLSGTPTAFRSTEDKITVMVKLMGLPGALWGVERPAPLPIPGETSEITCTWSLSPFPCSSPSLCHVCGEGRWFCRKKHKY